MPDAILNTRMRRRAQLNSSDTSLLEGEFEWNVGNDFAAPNTGLDDILQFICIVGEAEADLVLGVIGGMRGEEAVPDERILKRL